MSLPSWTTQKMSARRKAALRNGRCYPRGLRAALEEAECESQSLPIYWYQPEIAIEIPEDPQMWRRKGLPQH